MRVSFIQNKQTHIKPQWPYFRLPSCFFYRVGSFINCSFSPFLYKFFMIKKVTLFLIFVLALSKAFEFSSSYSYDNFYQWKGRDYVGAEKENHRIIFNSNYEKMMDAVARGEDRQVNEFLDWDQSQLEAFFNFNPDLYSFTESPREARASSYEPPNTFDWRKTKKVSSVKNQLHCGSSWAFATTGLFESQFLIHDDTEVDLAEQFAIQCENSGHSGCSGESPLDTLNFFKQQKGFPLESHYPYTGSNEYSGDSFICQDPQHIYIDHEIKEIKFHSNLTPLELKFDLIEHGPVVVAVSADTPAFYSVGASGIVDKCDKDQKVDHLVLLIGYTQTHWIVKNSWGNDWGADGYAYISIENDCGLSKYAFEMIVDPTPKNPNPNYIPQPQEQVELSVVMSDSFGDGWNGNILGLKQGNSIVEEFGESFKSGKSMNQSIKISAGKKTYIIVAQKSSFTSEIGFTITFANNGSVLYSRKSGTPFSQNSIFYSWCPKCQSQEKKYSVILFDEEGNGWNNNQLYFGQEGKNREYFGDGFNFGKKYGPLHFTFEDGKSVKIGIHSLGSFTHEIGFEVLDEYGHEVFKMEPGSKFYANHVLGNFCPDCENLKPIKVISNAEVRDGSGNSSGSGSGNNDLRVESEEGMTALEKRLIFSFVVIILVGVILLVVKKFVLEKKNEDNDHSNKYPGTSSQLKSMPDVV